MGLIRSGLNLMLGAGFGVYVAQNYNVPDLRKLFYTGMVISKHLEQNYRKKSNKRDQEHHHDDDDD